VSDVLVRLLEPGALSAVFQPVVEASSSRIHYFEGLLRGPRQTRLETPTALFDYARRRRAEAVIDRAAVRTVLREAAYLPPRADVGVNVHASTLSDLSFLEFFGRVARECAINPERLVVEVVEHRTAWEPASLGEVLTELRASGVRVALDDLGMGHSNFRMVLACRAEYLKLDGFFIQDCHRDPERRAILSSVAHLAAGLGASVVAEGVEAAPDLEVVVETAIRYVQGRLLQPPRPASALAEDAASE
jgi:EAL domain-containing protein (putative c-di-GMP-specific phosphodiesterase class I)